MTTYDGIVQATEDAFRLLSKDSQLQEAQDSMKEESAADEIFESHLSEEDRQRDESVESNARSATR